MEIIEAPVYQLEGAIDYYINQLGIFSLRSQTSESAVLVYHYENNIVLHLNTRKKSEVFNISLQVPNTEKLFDRLEELGQRNLGIISGAYKTGGQEITYLDTPIGDYFYTKDEYGNVIQFFDKIDERQ